MDSLTFSIGYLNAGFLKRLHRAARKLRVCQNVSITVLMVSLVGVIVVLAIRTLDPADGQLRNDFPLFRFGQS